jgi:hypothetical protein
VPDGVGGAHHRGVVRRQGRSLLGRGLSQRCDSIARDLARERNDGLRVRGHDPEDIDRARIDLADAEGDRAVDLND